MGRLELVVCVLIVLNQLFSGVNADEGADPLIGLVIGAVISFFVLIAAVGVCILGVVWNDWFPKRQWLRGKQKTDRIDIEHERFEDDKSVISKGSRMSKAPSSIHNHAPKILAPDTVQLTDLRNVRPIMNGQLQTLDSPRYEEKGKMLNFGNEDGDGNYKVTSPSEIEYNEKQIVPIVPQRQEVIKRELIPVVQEITHNEPVITQVEKQPVIVKVIHKYPTATQIVEEPVIAEVTHPEKVITKKVDVPVVKEIEHDEPIVTQVEERPIITKELHKYPTSMKVVEKPIVKTIEHDQQLVTQVQEREVVAREVHRYPTATKVVDKPVVKRIDHKEPIVTAVRERSVVAKEIHQYPTATKVVQKPIVKTIEHGEPIVTNVEERPVVTKELHKYPTSTRVVEKPVVKNIQHERPVVTKVVERPTIVRERHAYPSMTRVVGRPQSGEVVLGVPQGSVRDGNVVDRVIQMPAHGPPSYEYSKKVINTKQDKKSSKKKKDQQESAQYETVTGVMNFGTERPSESSSSDDESETDWSSSSSSGSGYIQPTIEDPRASTKSQNEQWAMY